MKDLKYLAAYINPAFAVGGLLLGGWFTYMNVIFVFVLVPIFDQVGPESEDNVEEHERLKLLKKSLFDWLLYLNLPLLYGILILFIFTIDQNSLATYELVGNILSVGIVIGTCGINVGHELGHRKSKWENTIAQLLLIPALYIHFFIEHNRGHHKYVGTEKDPASAEKGQGLYHFWIKSTFMGYLNAWKLEGKRLQKSGQSALSFKNQMIRFTLVQFTYILIIYMLVSPVALVATLLAGVVGVLLLETINYLEHYGLRREKLQNGRYEKVHPRHSWNANFQFGRIVLYELTRHSDHHFIASKKYQVLDHHDSSPQLPFGYPMMILVALVPPLWFWIMDSRIQ
ncbi:MAG: alkane 1-monooxygenase [Balneolaceae bacterium]